MGELAKPYEKLPRELSNIAISYGAWFVGSAVEWLLHGGPKPRDIDLFVPPQHWQAAVRALSKIAVEVNHFGGVKVELDGLSVDIWPMHLEDFFTVGHGQALRLEPRCLLNPTKG